MIELLEKIKEQEKLEIAKNFVSLEDISKTTGLDNDALNELSKSNKLKSLH